MRGFGSGVGLLTGGVSEQYMRELSEGVLRQSRGLSIDGVLVGADVLTQAIRPCDAEACGGRCCRFGALMEEDEFQRIDAMMPRVIARLRPAVQRVIKRQGWVFKNLIRERYADPNKRFRASKVVDGYCVFLLAGRGEGCALHQLALEEGGAVSAYKPRECFLFPLTDVIRGEVHLHAWKGYSCNVETPGEPLAYLKLEQELIFLLGDDGYQQLLTQVDAFKADGGVFQSVEIKDEEPLRRGRPPKKSAR